MKAKIWITMACLTMLAGCSKTAVVLGKNGIVTAVTEAPTFRKRTTLIKETTRYAQETCEAAKGTGLPEIKSRDAEGKDPKGKKDEGADSGVLKEAKELFDLVENLIDIVPSHSVSVSMKCKGGESEEKKP